MFRSAIPNNWGIFKSRSNKCGVRFGIHALHISNDLMGMYIKIFYQNVTHIILSVINDKNFKCIYVFNRYIKHWKMRNVIFDFDHLNTCIISIRESCVLVKGCSMFHVICLIHFYNNVPVFLSSYLLYASILFSYLI